jgi:hypothetical protein
MKGAKEMEIRKIFLLAGLLTALTLLIPCSQVLAGGGVEPPPEGAIFEGPEIWGIVVMFCGPGVGDDTATVRFKRIVDSNVETEALVDLGWALECPPDEAGAAGHTLPEGTTVFGKATPYITKVKNFKKEGNIVSFDAQFKYWHR